MGLNASYLLSVVWSMEQIHWITLPTGSLAVTVFVNVDVSSKMQMKHCYFFKKNRIYFQLFYIEYINKFTGDVDCCGCGGLPGDVLVLVEVDGTFAGIDLTKLLCAV